MNDDQINKLIYLLKEKNISFSSGLTDSEFMEIERKYDVIFPPDLKLFLKKALPISSGFMNWREGINSFRGISQRFEIPLEGILFDVKYNDFWFKEWGNKPKDEEDQEKIIKKHYNEYPKLIPIYSHRYIPATPNERDNPVFSVHQTDIIYYGYNLTDYLCKEFKLPSEEFVLPEKPKNIQFWSSIVDLN